MESFQKRDRDRKKIQKRNEKAARRKERAERKRGDGVPEPGLGSDEVPASAPPSPLIHGVVP